MKFLKVLTFRSKILAVLLLTTMLLSSFSFLLIQSIDNINEVSNEIQYQNIPELVWISLWEEELSIKEFMVIGYINNNLCCDLMSNYQSYVAETNEHLKDVTPIPPSMESFEKKLNLLDFMVINNVRGLIAIGDKRATVKYIEEQYLPQLKALKKEVNDKQESVLLSLNHHSSHFSSIIKESLWLLLILTSVSLLLSIIAAYRISMNLTRPIETMINKVDRIAHGEYGLTVDNTEQIELQKLGYSINQMSTRLKESFDTIVNDKIYREQILNSLPVGIITVDEKLGDISLNYAAKQLLGENESLTTENVMDVNGNKQFWEHFSTKQIINNVKVSYNFNDEIRSLLVSQSKLLSQRQEVIGWIFYFIDITETELLEKRINQSEKLALVGELAAGAAHEIRNPLAVIDGFLNLMNQSLSETEKETFHLPLLMMELKRINSIIEEMLLLTKPSAPQFKMNYIEEVINEILPLIRQASGNEQVDFQLELENLPLLIDEKQMKQVFHNLIRNSVEAMGGTGTVSIYSKVLEDTYHIFIEDNGPGIPAHIIQSIFAPFLTSKENGTGLGLTIVQRIIDYHHGEIRLLSTSKQGTIFEIVLPLSTEYFVGTRIHKKGE